MMLNAALNLLAPLRAWREINVRNLGRREQGFFVNIEREVTKC